MKELVLKRDPRTGLFYVRPYLGRSVITKKPIRPYKCFPEAEDEEEARRAAEAWAAGLARSSDLRVRRRLDELLPRYVMWLADQGSPANTVKTYRSTLRYATRYLGAEHPDAVSSFDVELVYATLQRKGGRHGDPLSPNTVRKLHGFLAAAWIWMSEQGICTRNPMPLVHKPPKVATPAVAFDDDELAAVLAELERIMADDALDDAHVLERNMAAAAYLASRSGEREGEACGQDRGDLSVRRRSLVVCSTAVAEGGASKRQPRTKGRRRRVVSLDKEAVGELVRHMRWQEGYLPQRLLSERRRVPLFTDAQGRRLKPAELSAWFSALRDRLGLPAETHFHTLRHTHASILLDEGTDLRTIAERLGHAREGFTLETYAHMRPGRDQDAAQVFGSAMAQIRGRDP